MSKPITIVFDPGHGGHDPGALSPFGMKESDVVLDVCQRAKRILDKNGAVNLLMTRNDDIFISLSGRAKFANDRAAQIFLSVHCNSAAAPTAHGYECFTSIGTTRSDAMATRLLDLYGKEFPDLRPRHDWTDGDPDKEAKFTVLTQTKMPALLHELEFIHTEKGHAFLASFKNRDRIATVLASWTITEAHRIKFGT